MCEFFAAFWYFLVFTIVFLYYRSERVCCHMESWSSQELYSPAMHHSKHLEAASPHGPGPKLTFVAALLGFLASFSKSDGVGALLWRTLGQMVWGVTPHGNSCANSDAAASPIKFSLGDRIILCIFSLCVVQISWVSPEYWSRDGRKEELLVFLWVNGWAIPGRRLCNKNESNSFVAASD